MKSPSGLKALGHWLQAFPADLQRTVSRLIYNLDHPYFDANWYRKRHQLSRRQNARRHYLRHARKRGFDPNPYFASAWYAARYLADKPHINPLRHYLTQGQKQGCVPHPLWSDERYLRYNPDIAQSIAAGQIPSGYEHFLKWGANEIETGCYRHFGFDWGERELDYDRVAYLRDNPDVERAINAGEFPNALAHLFSSGVWEAHEGFRVFYSSRHSVRLIEDRPGLANGHGSHLCLFAHYDRDDVVDDYVLTYLKSLRQMNVDIVFITATQTADELEKVLPLVQRILVKNDSGRDFGSWWLALTQLGLDCGQGYDRVIFANDSIYFPVRPVKALFADMYRKGYNLYGLSDSRECFRYHVQSFFLAFDRKAQECLFPKFLSSFSRNYLLSKWGQIREYEVGFTRIAQEAGLSVGAFFSFDDGREEALRRPELARWRQKFMDHATLNPTHDLWDMIIEHYASPVLKIELLRDNPKNANGFEALPELIADGAVPIAEIQEHQSRIRATPRIKPAIWQPAASNVELRLLKKIKGSGRAQAPRLVLFAHYDPQAMIDPYVVTQVKALEAADCAVAFITATAADHELSKVLPHVRDVLVKSDCGRDFGSWYLAIHELKDDFAAFGSVIWMNDSTYFPLFDPRTMLQEMERRDLDFWGIVDSYNITWHAMSWWWAFGRRAIQQGWFDWFEREHNPTLTKWGQIINYEMRLPRLIRETGLKADAYIRVPDVRQFILKKRKKHARYKCAERGDFTMTHDFWSEIITEFHCPALKIELLRDNPLGIDLSTSLDVIGHKTTYDPQLIRNHLMRVKASHLPPPETL